LYHNAKLEQIFVIFGKTNKYNPVMKKSSILSIIGIMCGLTSVILAIKGIGITASILGLVAYFATEQAYMKETAGWQAYAFVFAAGMFGYALSHSGNYFMIGAMLSMAIFLATRLVLFENISHAGARWLDPLILIISLGCYVAANLYDSMGWQGWVIPAPVILHGLFRTLGLTIDSMDINKFANTQYIAKVGNPAPIFTLPDEENNTVCLSDFRGKRHVLLIFVRGDWCPTCHIMLRAYEKHKGKFAEKNVILLAVGPDSIGVNRDMVLRLGLDYKLLCDDKAQAAKAYGMMFQSNNPMTKYGDGIPLPASFLVDINGTLLYTSDPHKPGAILTPDTIFPVIEKLGATA
jgi:peroxiredoxin